ncbi:hypothetical protein ACWFNE_00140 [Cellulomonas sp. NPDC055163]
MRWVARCLASVLAALAVSALVGTPLPAGAAGDDRPSISTDATGPLVDARDLAPGPLTPVCVRVSWAGADRSVVAVTATVGGSGLADFLDIEVELGDGGEYGDCAGFTGERVFAGTLAELAALPARAAPSMPADGSGSATYRLTFSLRSDDAAQGRTATAELGWLLTDAPSAAVPTLPPRAAPSSSPAADEGPLGDAPVGDPTTGSDADDASPAAPGTPQVRARVVVPFAGVASSPGAAGPGAPGGTDPGGAADPGPTSTGPTSPDGVQPGAAGPPTAPGAPSAGWLRDALSGAPFPLLLIVLVMLYLAVQDRVDSGDPKLARASLRAAPTLPFPDDDRPEAHR